MRCVSWDGTAVVEVIRLSCTPNRRDGEWLRIKRHGVKVAEVRTVSELADLGIDPADMRTAREQEIALLISRGLSNRGRRVRQGGVG